MLLLAGTIPDPGLPLIYGRVRIKDGRLFIGERSFYLNRGTPSMIGTATTVCQIMGLEEPYCVIAGDIGKGDGSKLVYNYLTENIHTLKPTVCSFHYIMPDLMLHYKLFSALKNIEAKPFLIADAGYMYIAKMSGNADFYDLFTPDLGELAFLADENSPHPFYTRGFIFHRPDEVEDFITKAYKTNGTPRFLLVKGHTDFICENGRVLKMIDEPNIEALECIGGTGDTITGMVAGLIYGGHQPLDACYISAMANRIAGSLANPTPATQVMDVIQCIPEALKTLRKEHFNGRQENTKTHRNG
jgi:NAD(P)H-hydrate repair Nnr-like enzyme with NAD(P)H-hydrate dehydratase domain